MLFDAPAEAPDGSVELPFARVIDATSGARDRWCNWGAWQGDIPRQHEEASQP